MNRIKVVLLPRIPIVRSESQMGWDRMELYFSIGEDHDKSSHAGYVDQVVERMGLAGKCYVTISEEESHGNRTRTQECREGQAGQTVQDPGQPARV